MNLKKDHCVLLVLSHICLVLGLAIMPTTSSLLAKAEGYHHKKRTKYIMDRLKLMESLPTTQLKAGQIWANHAARSLCDTPLLTVKMKCMMDKAKQYCQDLSSGEKSQRQCLGYMDVIIINSLSSSSFISNRERYTILKNAREADVAYNNILMLRYGELAASYAMSDEFVCGISRPQCFATGIDQFCKKSGDKGRLTWQSCVGALIQFSTTTKE